MREEADLVGALVTVITVAAWAVLGTPGSSWALAGTRPGSSKIPRIEWAEFPKELAPDAGKARLGYLFVRENRHDPIRGERSGYCGPAADSATDAAYPDLENRFLRLLAEVKEQPIAVRTKHSLTNEPVTVALDAEGVFHCACRLIENGSYLTSFPRTMDLMCSRQVEVFQHFLDMMMGPQDYAWGMAYSFWPGYGERASRPWNAGAQGNLPID